jgi:hypothetical protein
MNGVSMSCEKTSQQPEAYAIGIPKWMKGVKKYLKISQLKNFQP